MRLDMANHQYPPNPQSYSGSVYIGSPQVNRVYAALCRPFCAEDLLDYLKRWFDKPVLGFAEGLITS